jgi:hypothetical protein
MGHFTRVLIGAVTASAFAVPAATAQTVPDYNAGDGGIVEPMVLKGSDLAGWAVPANQTARLPLVDLFCWTGGDGSVPDPTSGGGSDIGNLGDNSNCPHSHYAEPHVDTSKVAAPAGTEVDRLFGFRWDPYQKKFLKIPLQVDEVFTRYLNNEKSGFSLYSGEDQHTTYAYDREGFRFREDGTPEDPCTARPDSPAATDPVKGLDANDELAFMVADAGPQAPVGAALPPGIEAIKEIVVKSSATTGYGYIGRAKPDGPRYTFSPTRSYVKYERDANADTYAFSQSSYDSYGAAPEGYYCDAEGNIVRNADGTPKIGQRRPRDGATITTNRYKYRYDGRWLMTKVQISPDKGKTYGEDLVDRWKARAFAQDPGSETPCCGYEEEETNWGGSSILLGEKVGPVRAIRETWGADSGTNVIRRETFYRDTMKQKTWLRVHVIPPLDGIYAQWDFNAGAVDTFYNAKNPAGVKIDGRNDELIGNFDDPCNPKFDDNDTSAFDQNYRSLYRELQFCEFPYHLSIDAGDPSFADANAALGWSQVSGPSGTIVDRISFQPGEMPVGGAVQSLAAVPYYRDDSCFDDGTGSNPGPKLRPRSADEPAVAADGTARKCWEESDGKPNDSDHFYQGSIGTHGVHLLFLADSDNARQTVPVTEIIQDWSMVMLPGNPGNVGEKYGRQLEKPMVGIAADRVDLKPEVTSLVG